MKLVSDGSVSRYYAETLVLLFFPGSKFPENDESGDEIVITASAHDGTATGRVTVSSGAKSVCGEYTVPTGTAADVSSDMLLKLAAGGAMLEAGRKFTGIVPPWGMLTGVRPAKMALEIMKTAIEKNAADVLAERFLCSRKKADLAVSCAETESVYITETSRRECSIYVAIPFCPTRCSYCSFVSFTSPKLLSLIPAYLSALCRDIENVAALVQKLGIRVSDIYIGGGTPTTLSAAELEVLLSRIGDCFDIQGLSEFTLEAGRPDTITAEKLAVAKRHGVTRVSVNTQTLNDEILSSIGRKHTAEDFFRAYETARNSGIRDINVDLIAGLPGESAESFARSVDGVLSLSPENITVHTFYVKRAAEILKNNLSVYRAEDARVIQSTDYSQSALSASGYRPYYMYRQKNTAANLENAGFALPGHECLYNIYMMDEIHSVFGAGASAMTKLVSPDPENMKIRRICETKYPYEYLDGYDDERGTDYRRRLSESAEQFYKEFF